MALNDGLVGLWHFTGNTNDSSGNGYNLTNNGADLTTDKNSVSNQAYDFIPGNNDYMDSPTIPALSNWSISLFYKADQTSSKQLLLTSDTTGGAGNNQMFVQSGNIYFQCFASGGGAVSVATDISDWHHVVVTFDGSTLKLYYDGNLVDSDACSASAGATVSGTYKIGEDKQGNSQNFDGKLDEIRIYNREITAYEAVQLYTGYDTDETCVDTLGTNLKALYHFTGNANDSSGNGYNGTVTGATLTTDKNSVSNQAYNFDGDSDYIDTSSTIISNMPYISVSSWLNFSSLTGTSEIIYQSLPGTDTFQIRTDSGVLGVYCYGSQVGSLYTFSSTSTWYHLVVIFNTITNFVYVYVDNSLVKSQALTMAAKISTELLGIGGDRYGNYPALSFRGKLDEIRIYDRVITDDEIDLLYVGYDNPSEGYSNKVNGITPSKINGIDVANVSKFNGI